MKEQVLIIDDEKKIGSLLARIIELEGFHVFLASNGKEGLNVLRREEIYVVISDVKLPDTNGVELVKEIKKIRPAAEVINLTAFGTIEDGVRAMRNGAFDYITKGDDNDRIIPLLYKAMEQARQNTRGTALTPSRPQSHSFKTIIGNAPAIRAAIKLAQKVASRDTTVLLLGETGTGKEVFAQSIHLESQRGDQAFVALNCSGFNPELLESELFGHRSGAFTGAVRDKKGLLEEANGGTLFLDEIGEMGLDLQAKLLRVLESQTFIKVGDTRTQHVNIRIIAATNRDLKREAENGRFRLDLYYRLSVFTIELPSLSDRREDLLPLAEHFLAVFRKTMNRPELRMDPGFIEGLHKHHWKGNIRELRNVMERVTILAEGQLITADLLPFEFLDGTLPQDSMKLQEMEKLHILKVLRHTLGNKTETARLLGIGLSTLYRKIDDYQLPG